MSRRQGPDVGLTAVLTFAGLGAAVVVFMTLWSTSRPPHLKSRLEALEAATQGLQTAARPSLAASVYLTHALCGSAPATATEVVRTELARAAAGAGLGAAQITFAPTSMTDASDRTFPVLFSVEATERYDILLGFLQRLSASEPQVFADTIDLTSKTSAVSLKLTGRVECEPTS